MKAIGYKQAGPITAKDSLIEFETEKPVMGSKDLLVRVKGISVNPVDSKVRTNITPENGFKIIGYDASGVVEAIGSEVTKFQIGDEVFYAGDITRSGSNAEYQAVDERIVGKKPQSLDFPEAAGIPLTAITAWELLFESLHIQEGTGQGESILIIAGAGGVGSILIQLAKKLTKLTVIATASRPETVAWTKKMGADHVVNHRDSLVDQLQALNLQPKYVASLSGSDQHFPSIIELIKPRGHIAFIDDPKTLDIKVGKQKALTFSWEFMFTRSKFQTDDIAMQHELLNRVSALIDRGTLLSTVTHHFGKISVDNLKAAHVKQESGESIGKNVLEGF